MEPPVLANDDPALARWWHPVARADEVGAAPLGVELLGRPWVLARLPGGVAAFEDRCPHRQAPLSAGRVVDGTIECPYHGWRFAAGGACCAIPALGDTSTIPPRARLRPAAAVAEHLGLIWLAPEAPAAPLAAVAEVGAPGFATGWLEPAAAAVSAGLMIDNFLDVAHFPFLHAGTFGTDESTVTGAVAIESGPTHFVARSEHPFANREDPGVADGRRPLVQHRRLTYRYDAPFSVSLRIEYVEAGGTNVIGFFVQPVAAGRCRLYTVVARDDLTDPAALADALAFEQRVLDEDVALQTRLPATLPLELTAEVHTRADLVTIELRRCLRRVLGIDGPHAPGVAGDGESGGVATRSVVASEGAATP